MLFRRVFFLSSLLCGALAQSTHPLQKYTISAPGINASFIPYGARLTNLYVNDRNGNPQDVVLGYDEGSQYVTDTETNHTYYGAVVGRYANRIKNGTFTVDGVTSHIPENDNMGHDTLHGGMVGYDQRNWTVVSANVSESRLLVLSARTNVFRACNGSRCGLARF